MKTIKALFLVAVFSFTTILAHANNEPSKSIEDLHKQLSELITHADFWDAEDAGTKIMVRLIITADNEILVLSTDNKVYDRSVKNLLNYKSAITEESLSNKTFFLPLRLESK